MSRGRLLWHQTRAVLVTLGPLTTGNKVWQESPGTSKLCVTVFEQRGQLHRETQEDNAHCKVDATCELLSMSLLRHPQSR